MPETIKQWVDYFVKQYRTGQLNHEPYHDTVESYAAWCICAANPKLKDSFAYSGGLPLGETWGTVATKHRDSELIYESNFDCIDRDLTKNGFDRYCQIEE